ncbi:MAG: type III-A CRISPR-associated RAMP protein Csm5 [Actinomycetota bacterium]|nr:type III-A CRISPR-associated RAMP protein Csm5 [Actinomycetota bacterium]
MSAHRQEYLISVKPVTPMIISSGAYLDACDYVLARPKQDGDIKLIAFNFTRLQDILADDEQADLLVAIEKNPFSTAQALNKISEKIAASKDVKRFSIPASNAFVNYIKERVNNTALDAQGELKFYLFQRTTIGPYIPGSSFKGAIRTGVAFAEALKKRNVIEQTKRKIIKDRDFEKHLFDNRETFDDPFRQLKISDSTSIQTQAVVEQFINLKAGKVEKGARTLCEAAVPAAGKSCQLNLIIDNRMIGKTNSIKSNNKLTAKQIVDSCRQFYKAVLEKDLEFFKKVNSSNGGIRINLAWQVQILEALGQDSGKMVFPIKLGLGTSNYAKSFKPHFTNKYPISRKVIDKGVEMVPLGWAIAELEEV